MKKFIRFVVILLLIVAAAVVILGIYEPKEKTIVRTTLIKAPKEVVFAQIVNFKNWPNWCPWYIMDSGKMKMTFYGTDGQPGSGYKWEGVKTGAGDMKDSAVNGTSMTYALTFYKPSENTAWGYLKAEDTAGMTKVTWTMSIHFPFPFNAMCVFMNMDKILGGDFEDGLRYMKTYVESHTDGSGSATGMDVEEVEYPAHTFEGAHSIVRMSDMMKYFDSTVKIMKASATDKINGPSSGLYYTWDTLKKETDMAAVFPVSDTTKAVKGMAFIHIAAAKAVMVALKGGYGREMEAHEALKKYMAAKGMALNMVIEDYRVGPHEEADSNKWVTNIYCLIK